MRRMKLHNTIEYIKQSDFYHDTFDLEDGIKPILAAYGVLEEFADDELQALEKEIYELAEQNEFSEALVLAANLDTIEGLSIVEAV